MQTLRSRLSIFARDSIVEIIATSRRRAEIIIRRVLMVAIVEAIGQIIAQIIATIVLLPIFASGCVICIASERIVLPISVRPLEGGIGLLSEEGFVFNWVVDCRVACCAAIFFSWGVVLDQDLRGILA